MDGPKLLPVGPSKELQHLEEDVRQAREWTATSGSARYQMYIPTSNTRQEGRAILERRKAESDLAWKDFLQGRQRLREERVNDHEVKFRQELINQAMEPENLRKKANRKTKMVKALEESEEGSEDESGAGKRVKEFSKKFEDAEKTKEESKKLEESEEEFGAEENAKKV
ncbi:hypothetical protein LZ32DRAFT_622745 [Colletotrichum eremochloae]|nr:hypothetical protein LZ32DRAFT_622745 [Colletotrichum eremochloae]